MEYSVCGSMFSCVPSHRAFMQNSVLNQRLRLSLLICFFALKTIFSFDIFIGVLWPLSSMKMLRVSSHWVCILNMSKWVCRRVWNIFCKPPW